MITVQFDDESVLASLQRLVDSLADPTPAFRDIGEYLVDSTKRRFAAGKAPDGSAWAPNRPSTLAGKPDSRPLIGESKRLSSEIHYVADAAGVQVGSSLIYAATQQFGADKGAFGSFSVVRTRQEVPIPWGDIPARPFLGISEDDRAAILDIVQEHLQGAVGA